MNRLYTILCIFLSTILLVSFSTDPPNGKTGAPGDSFCTECHVQPSSTLDGELSLEGFPNVITPNQTYTLTVVSRNTVGDAVKGGFQMTILGPTNTRAGTMASPSSSSALQTSGGRQYFEHRPAVTYPDSNVIRWTVDWTAPELASGSQLTYYLAGVIANGNFQNIGDKVKSASGNGIVVISANEEFQTFKPILYPNPGTDVLHISTEREERPDGTVVFYNGMGAKAGQGDLVQGVVEVPELAPGMYWLEVRIGNDTRIKKWIRL